MKDIDYINAKINKQDAPVPQFLYKYRLFDEHTFDMLDNGYVYLCPAERLDDPSECKVDFSVQDFYDLHTNRLTFKGVEMILSYIKPYTTEENFLRLKEIVYRTLSADGLGQGPNLLEAYFEMQGLVPEDNLVPLINQLRNIPEKINEPQTRQQFIKLFSLAHDARRDMGICSLSELKDCAEMWQNYADNSKGYCIEYDMHEYENLYALFPVVYDDFRETNIVINILFSFIGEMIFGISNGQIPADKSQFIRMFLTKDLIWSYQKEWRLLGDANVKLSAPKLNAIYLGKNISKENKQQMIDYCEKYNLKCVNVIQRSA